MFPWHSRSTPTLQISKVPRGRRTQSETEDIHVARRRADRLLEAAERKIVGLAGQVDEIGAAVSGTRSKTAIAVRRGDPKLVGESTELLQPGIATPPGL